MILMILRQVEHNDKCCKAQKTILQIFVCLAVMIGCQHVSLGEQSSKARLKLPHAASLALREKPPKSPSDSTSTQSSRPTEKNAKKEAPGRYDWFVTPLMAFNSDNGLGFGARAELARREPDYHPYRVAYMAQFYASLRNYHFHLFRYDCVGVGGNKNLRLTINGVYRQWGNDGFWGLGNYTTRMREYVGDFDSDDPKRKRYIYKLIQPYLHTALRVGLWGHWAGFISLIGKWSDIESYSGSLMEEQKPYGMDGGLNVILSSGVLYDSRQPEADPQRGIFAEASGFGGIPSQMGTGKFLGLFFSFRAYHPLTSWMVLAWRAMTEMMFGDVPFYEMVHWHGSIPIAGFGGFEGVRGVPFGRWRGPHRAIASAELRFRLYQLSFRERSIALQLGVFSDSGLVWGEEPNIPTNDPNLTFPVHTTGGLGLRLIYAETFVARFDAGFGNDPVLETSGEVSNALSYGLYLTFGHSY